MYRVRNWVAVFGLLATPLTALAGDVAVMPEWLDWLSNPDVAYLLFLLALLGLLVEIASPGMTLPGLLGAAGIILSLYALQLQGAQMWALLVMVVGLVLIVLPLFRPGLSSLAWAGVGVFGLGSFLFLNAPSLEVSLPVMVGLTLASGWFYLWVVSRFGRLRQLKSVSGHDALLGQQARVLADFTGEGRVEINGALWSAVSDAPLVEGERVEIVAVDGLTLSVRKTQE